MAKKKIKFALKMKDDTEARNLQELKEFFDLNQTVAYFLDGKLETWLLDRYYEDLAEKISNLDKSDPELRKKLCEIFEVEYEEDSLSIEEIEERNRRIKKLKEVTDDEEIIKHVDKVAFSQEELADLLDDGQETIYLCGTGFHIPASKKGIRYIGIETKLDITEEEIEKYQANDIELIDLLEGYFDESKEDFGKFLPNEPESKELPGITIRFNGRKVFLPKEEYYPYNIDDVVTSVLLTEDINNGRISVPENAKMVRKINGHITDGFALMHDKNNITYVLIEPKE